MQEAPNCYKKDEQQERGNYDSAVTWSKHSASKGLHMAFTSQVQVLIAPQILVWWANFIKTCCRSLYKEMLGDNGESLEVLCIYSIKKQYNKVDMMAGSPHR